MANFAGFDRLGFPGQQQMAWLKANTNLVWCGFYLAPAPSHSNGSWMGSRKWLADHGWGILPVYVGQQTSGPGSHNVNGSQGMRDGVNAAALASNEGFPQGTSIYIDVEDGSALSPDASAYLASWAKAVIAAGYAPAFYCSYRIASSIAALATTIDPPRPVRIWPFRVKTTDPHAYAGDIGSFGTAPPANCGYPGATAWQYEQNISLSLPDAPLSTMGVDLSTSLLADPGAP